MHIPNSMLNGAICPVTAAISTASVIMAGVAAAISKVKISAARFGAITAFIFAAQMMNFPVQNGTSGHFLGAALAVALLGLPFGLLSMALVVSIQCIVFSDGGFSVLGANILNMAVIGAGIGGILHNLLARKTSDGSSGYLIGLGFIAWVSIMSAALACSLELAISGTVEIGKVLPSMLGVHAVIGVGEGLITIAAYAAFSGKVAVVTDRRSAVAPLAVAGITAAILSPFASGYPDGLEWVAEKYRFLHDAAPSFVSPMPDYSIPAISGEALSTGLSGLAGVVITFVTAMVVIGIVRAGKTALIKQVR
ncbi:MAG: energy-coupling factor ABC transporter permease [Candidatus Omnitrophica bacterium]|nr:energy-coupling factor ABC transporter permease [Candidatus Omnitrophota bacterium]MDD5487840.1 energy-coupling factor ABC transporter permease [Candidatus Omnitrophota bacterium]